MQNEIWFRPLIWMDYRLALLFTVVIPLILLIWEISGLRNVDSDLLQALSVKVRMLDRKGKEKGR